MAEQNLHQVRPFMTKQTFDQVTAAMWGQNTLDYHINYIIPRANWEDSDVREEALYFGGVARGLRLGASQKPGQQALHQGSGDEQFDIDPNRINDHFGSSSPGHPGHAALGEHSNFGAAVQSHATQTAIPDPTGLPPFRYVFGNAFRTIPWDHSTWDKVGLGPRYDSNADAPVGVDVGYTGGNPHIASPLDQGYQLNLEPYVQDSNLRNDASTFAGTQQRANAIAAQGKGQEIADPSGILSALDGSTVNIPLTQSTAASQSRGDLPQNQQAPQPPAAQRKKQSIMVPLVEYQPENDYIEDFFKVSPPSSHEEGSGEGDLDESMEQWFEDQAAREW